MKRGTLIFFLILFIVCVAVSFLFFGRTTDIAVIYIDGEEYARINLSSVSETRVITLPHNTLVAENGQICVTEADCPDKLCIKQGKKSGGVPIVCLPNRMTVVFEKGKGADALSW